MRRLLPKNCKKQGEVHSQINEMNSIQFAPRVKSLVVKKKKSKLLKGFYSDEDEARRRRRGESVASELQRGKTSVQPARFQSSNQVEDSSESEGSGSESAYDMRADEGEGEAPTAMEGAEAEEEEEGEEETVTPATPTDGPSENWRVRAEPSETGQPGFNSGQEGHILATGVKKIIERTPTAEQSLKQNLGKKLKAVKKMKINAFEMMMEEAKKKKPQVGRPPNGDGEDKPSQTKPPKHVKGKKSSTRAQKADVKRDAFFKAVSAVYEYYQTMSSPVEPLTVKLPF